jgi:hypothetical protein
MNGEVLYRETQGFSAWTWVIPALVLVLLAMLLLLRMTTTVTPRELIVRCGLLYTARVPLSDIASAAAIAYRPVRDYGGWGIRGSRRRRALNARGDRGVLITRSDGSTLLVGSQRPRELLDALARAGVPTEDRLPVVVREF